MNYHTFKSIYLGTRHDYDKCMAISVSIWLSYGRTWDGG